MRFLIVDDSVNDIALLRNSLQTLEKVEITPIESGNAALQLLSTQNDRTFDLIVIDWRLPGVVGDQLAQAFLKHPTISSKTPVVVLSSSLPPQVSDKLQECGALVLEKPVDLDGYEALAARLCDLAKRPNKDSRTMFVN